MYYIAKKGKRKKFVPIYSTLLERSTSIYRFICTRSQPGKTMVRNVHSQFIGIMWILSFFFLNLAYVWIFDTMHCKMDCESFINIKWSLQRDFLSSTFVLTKYIFWLFLIIALVSWIWRIFSWNWFLLISLHRSSHPWLLCIALRPSLSIVP